MSNILTKVGAIIQRVRITNGFVRTKRTAPLAVACIIAGVAGTPAMAEDLTFMSGQTGGTWDGIAGVMKQMIEKNVPGTSVDIRPGGASANVKAVNGGLAQIGLMLSTMTVDGLAGKPPFTEPMSQVCNLATLHPTVVQYVTNNSDIQSLDDLKGKRVGTLPKGTGTEALARTMLGYHNISVDDLDQYNFGSFPDNGTMLKDNHIDIFMGSSGMPSGGIMDMFSSVSGLRMLPISDEDFQKLKADNAAWSRYTIKAGVYPGLDEDVSVVAFPTHMGINCGVPEEEVYQITKAFISNYKDLGAVISEINGYEVKDLTTDIGVPFHPGAVRAYKEAGAM